MWIGALFSMAVKYGEVALAVLYRKKDDAGRWYGGMMYVIRDGLGKKIPKGTAAVLGGGFACLCLSNALVTGNIVQSNAAANVLEPVPAWISGAVLALLTTAALVYGIGKAGDITLRLIPGMTLLYMVLSLWIILGNLELLPSIFRQICTEAFSFHALAGGFTGLGIRSVLRGIGQSGFGQSMRFGIARGIFSNEAGCGTSPSAHASADTKSPFHQGCYGILEVICDTLVLCTMTAFVLCIGDRQYGIFRLGGDNLSLRAYQMFGGDIVYGMMAVMVALFAYATILAQMYYASTALRYFTDRRWVHHLYTVAAVSCIIIGAVMETDTICALADGVICTMTCINTAVLFCMRREIYETVPEKKKDKS